MIAGRIPPEGFTLNIQKVLGSQAQPRLVPFLKGTLPAFRQALLDGSVVFEEINLEACAGPEFQLIKKVHVPHSSASVSFQNNNKPVSSLSCWISVIESYLVKIFDIKVHRDVFSFVILINF